LAGFEVTTEGARAQTTTLKDQIIKNFRFEIERRSVDFGGGWNLRFIERDADNGEEIEVGGGVFPATSKDEELDAYAEALSAGEEWIASK
jgi:hypothetical protein